MVEFLQFTLSGVSFGMIYAAIALSLVLIWRGTRLVNFAQGGMAMFTTYVAIEVIYHAGSYWAAGKPRLLEPGMVFTIEPGIYIPANTQGVDPKWWNIGVRIEDTILVKPDGTADCLSCGAPRDARRSPGAGR